MDLYEEAEYHERRKAKGGRGKGGRGSRQDGAIDDLPASEPPKDGMTRAEFKEWKLTQIELQKERLALIDSRMIRTTNLEEKLKNLKEVMGDDYDESHDVIDDDDEEEEHDPNVKPKIELISTQTIQQYEQQASKLTWLKKKLVKIRARGDHRRQQDLERLAEIEAREEEEELAASEAIERENKEPSALLDMGAALEIRKRREEERAEAERLANMSKLQRMYNTVARKISRGSSMNLDPSNPNRHGPSSRGSMFPSFK